MFSLLGRPRGAAALVGASAIALVASMSSAYAQEQQRSFNIPSQPLSSAILEFSRQSDVMVVADPTVVNGRRAPAVQGSFTPTEALNRLLAGSGLTASQRAEGGFVLASAASPTRLGAADPAASSEEEIIVTARKREESLTDVPISIDVLAAEEIERRGLVSGEDYLRGIPGVHQIGQTGGSTAIVIRGIDTSPSFQNFGTGATVATYFGETHTTYSAGLGGGANVDLKLVDIERVEVLRGPQGTTFGSSSMGGAVRVIPRDPDVTELEGSVGAAYSSTGGYGGDNHNVHGAINIPVIADRLAVRVVAYQFEDSGYYRNIAGSDAAFQTAAIASGSQAFATNDERVGDSEFQGFRASALWLITDSIDLTLNYATQTSEVDGQPQTTRANFDQAILQVAPEHALGGRTAGFFDTNIDLANATLNVDLGWANLVGTYSHIESGSQYASPRSAQAGTQPRSQLGTSDHSEDSGEIRLASDLDGPLNFLVGVYQEDIEDLGTFDYIWYGSLASMPAAFGTSRNIGRQVQPRTASQTAAFGEISWEIIDNLTLTGGLRYYEYERTAVVQNTGSFFNGAANPGTVSTSAQTSADGTTARVNLSYAFGDALLYATYSQGFRLGRPQAQLAAGACDVNSDGLLDGTSLPITRTGIVDSDSVDNFEIGGNARFFDGRLAVTGAIYRMYWDNIAVTSIAPAAPAGCGLRYDTNAGSAQSDGVEFQLTGHLTPNLRAEFGASYVDARLTENAPLNGFTSGTQLPSPALNANFSLQYDFLLADHPGFLRTDAIYVDPYYALLPPIAARKEGSYIRVDLAAGVTINEVDLTLFANNITDATIATAGRLYGYELRPRTIGARLSYSF